MDEKDLAEIHCDISKAFLDIVNVEIVMINPLLKEKFLSLHDENGIINIPKKLSKRSFNHSEIKKMSELIIKGKYCIVSSTEIQHYNNYFFKNDESLHNQILKIQNEIKKACYKKSIYGIILIIV